jgi:hypothetical protein
MIGESMGSAPRSNPPPPPTATGPGSDGPGLKVSDQATWVGASASGKWALDRAPVTQLTNQGSGMSAELPSSERARPCGSISKLTSSRPFSPGIWASKA